MNSSIDIHGLKELDARESDGLEVRLLWKSGSDDVILEINDSKLGDAFRLTVSGDRALDAFRHPYAYAALQPAEFELLAPVA